MVFYTAVASVTLFVLGGITGAVVCMLTTIVPILD